VLVRQWLSAHPRDLPTPDVRPPRSSVRFQYFIQRSPPLSPSVSSVRASRVRPSSHSSDSVCPRHSPASFPHSRDSRSLPVPGLFPDPDFVWRSRIWRPPASSSLSTPSVPGVRAFCVRPPPAVSRPRLSLAFARLASARLMQFLSCPVRCLPGYGSRLTPAIYLPPTFARLLPTFARLAFASSSCPVLSVVHQATVLGSPPRLTCPRCSPALLQRSRDSRSLPVLVLSPDPDCIRHSPASGSLPILSAPGVRASRVRPPSAVFFLSSPVRCSSGNGSRLTPVTYHHPTFTTHLSLPNDPVCPWRSRAPRPPASGSSCPVQSGIRPATVLGSPPRLTRTRRLSPVQCSALPPSLLRSLDYAVTRNRLPLYYLGSNS
jgi:hypothetical protein